MAANSGGIFTGRATDHAGLPHLVLTVLGGFRPQYYTNRTAQVEQVTIRFQAWNENIDSAITTVERIENIFRSANVALDSGTVICTTKNSDGIEMDPDPTSKGHDVYMGILELTFMVQRDPTA